MDSKQQSAKIRQLQKDLDEQDRVNDSALATIDKLRANINEQNKFTKVQQSNIDLLKLHLELQAAIFTRTFEYVQDLQKQMQGNLKMFKNNNN
jgi:signal transduction histidine kinase